MVCDGIPVPSINTWSKSKTDFCLKIKTQVFHGGVVKKASQMTLWCSAHQSSVGHQIDKDSEEQDNWIH